MAESTTLRTPLGRRVKIIEQGTGTPVVFLHSGVGSAGEWKQVFSVWPDDSRLIAIDAYRDSTGPGEAGRRTLDDYTDQVFAVADHVGRPVHLIGFSWGGATAIRAAVVAPEAVGSLTLVEPEAYALLRSQDPGAYAQICDLRDQCRAHIHAGRWHEAYEQFVDFYNGPGSFAAWPPARREAFLLAQQSRGDLWDVLFSDLLTPELLAGVTAPVHIIEGSRTSAVDHAICELLRRRLPHARHTVLEGAGHMMPLTHPDVLTRALRAGLEP